MNRVFAIDPGTEQSAFVLMDRDYKPLSFAKIQNGELLQMVAELPADTDVVIEMISSYGMPVGAEVFATVFWSGRFHQLAEHCSRNELVLRRDVKLNLCNSARARDSNIIAALKDRFGSKGTKAAPGWFYGMKADCWQAYALGATFIDARQS